MRSTGGEESECGLAMQRQSQSTEHTAAVPPLPIQEPASKMLVGASVTFFLSTAVNLRK